ncbi:MAG: hypothetical protein KME27_22845 [Lyngbya sp. HA4199-MV5]|jgi:hypothetical protein|nr:hypothetical protein [Lyngbya sp. HA4199-MV5]
MDQPFESDVMEDLAAETPISSADEYDAAAEEGFDAFGDDDAFANEAFTDGMDEFAAEGAAAFEEDAFGDELEGDLWDDQMESGEEFKPHRTNQRESNRAQHEQGQRRRGMDRGGERGDDRRQVPRRRPPGHRGPWPPRGNSFSDESFFDEMNAFEDGFEDNFEDGFASSDAFAEDESIDALDAMEAAIADALEAEDSDEFLRRAVQGVRRAAQVARQIGRGVGQVARVVGPVASMIPLPQAQAIGAIANIAGRLLADGADEFEALDTILSFAEEEDAVDAAAPIIAGLTVRTIMPHASRLNPTTRRQLVHSVRQSTQTLARRQGAQAVRAVPRVVQAVQRTVQRRRVPAQQLPQAVRRATASVARNPRLVSRLAQATQHASTVTRRYGTGTSTGIPQHLVIRGPVEITIRSR